MKIKGTSVAVQWLEICASIAGGTGSILARGTKIPHAEQHGQNINKQTKSLTLLMIKRLLRYHSFPIKMAVSDSLIIYYFGKAVEKHSYFVVGL